MPVSKKEFEEVLNRLCFEAPELAEQAELKSIWQVIEDPDDSTENNNSLEAQFVQYLRKRDALCPVLKFLLLDYLKTTTRNSLFREQIFILDVLAILWGYISGPFLQQVVGPLIEQIASSTESLEVDSSRLLDEDDNNDNNKKRRVNVKKNVVKLMDYIKQFLDRLFASENIFPEQFKIILQGLDATISIRFHDVGLSVIAGLLILRLINPTILFPQKHRLIDREPTSEGMRGLVIVSKVIQAMANDIEFSADKDPSMMVFNYFLRRQKESWRSFFHKIVTGDELITADTPVAMADLTPEDLIARSNLDIYSQLCCPITLTKQKKLIKKVLVLEKQTQGWKPIQKAGYSMSYKRLESGNGKIITRATAEVNLPLPLLFKILQNKYLHANPKKEGTKESDILEAQKKLQQEEAGSPVIDENSEYIEHLEKFSLEDARFEKKVLKKFNDSLSIGHTTIKLPFPFTKRDFVFLNYSECLPEENFAIVSAGSIDVPQLMPEQSGVVRGELMLGTILRGTANPNITHVSHVLHVDLKGFSSVIPSPLLKRTALSTQKAIFKQLVKFRIVDAGATDASDEESESNDYDEDDQRITESTSNDNGHRVGRMASSGSTVSLQGD